jgi:hypothetical protein
MIYLSEVFNPNKKKLIADFFLVGHLHLVDYFSPPQGVHTIHLRTLSKINHLQQLSFLPSEHFVPR